MALFFLPYYTSCMTPLGNRYGPHPRMITPIAQYSLKKHNTFGFDVYADYFVKIHNGDDLIDALAWAATNNTPVFPIGGGSNLLLTQPLKALVLQQCNCDIHLEKETKDSVTVYASAAVLWHDLVLYCVQHEYYGIENLSLIPGCVGAAPMQNIGAYGVELADVLISVNVIDIATGEVSALSGAECKFSYRESVFKNKFKGRYLITGISIKLQKNKQFNLSYAALKTAVNTNNENSLTLKMVCDTVCDIRRSKLPNPAELGNAGSFFKNPTIADAQLIEIQEKWPNIPFHKQPDGGYKIPAAWIVERSGWKGYQYKGVGVHRLQSIVLVNLGTGTGQEVLELADLIHEDVVKKFGISLEIEPVTL